MRVLRIIVLIGALTACGPKPELTADNNTTLEAPAIAVDQDDPNKM